MKQALRILMLCCAIVFIGTTLFAENSKPIVREKHKVIIDGAEELWSLQWTSTPNPACGPEDPDWMTCPCTGFAFGESGDLELVRKRNGHEDERLSLAHVFSEYEADIPATVADTPQAVLRRWDVYKDDLDKQDSPTFAARVKARPLARIMKFADYDHDGRATEFVLQIGTLPCGKRTSVVVGISRSNPHLHVFTSVERPTQALVLQAWHWESLRRAITSVKVIHWPCGDHGYDGVEEYELRADKGNIYAVRRQYECAENGKRGRLVKQENF
jgi:hypothetical protein